MRPYHIAWIVCLIALSAFVALKIASNAPTQQSENTASPVAGTQLGGPFVLSDHNSHTVTEKSWPGKYLLVYFGFTHCPDICPVGLNRIADAMKQLPSETRNKVQPLFITVDPVRDTPKVMKDYVTLFNASIIGLTGTDEQIKHVEKLYRVYAQKEGSGDDYMVNHSGYTYLMDPDGELNAVFPHETTADELAAQLKKNVAVTAP